MARSASELFYFLACLLIARKADVGGGSETLPLIARGDIVLSDVAAVL